MHAAQHDPPRGHRDTIRIERRQTERDVVRVDEFQQPEPVGQQRGGQGRFARAVRTAGDNDVLQWASTKRRLIAKQPSVA